MTDQPVKPERITKPIQLLGAWLAGLLAIDTCFLVAATRMPDTSWHTSALVIAAIANVPAFLFAVFILQTKFRPELQEDSYYSTYLSAKTNQVVKVSAPDQKTAALHEQIALLEARILQQRVASVAPQTESDISALEFGINRHLEDREAIQRKLREHNVLTSSLFGAEEPAKGRNVALSPRLSAQEIRSVLTLARELHFTTYNFIRSEGDEDIEEDVLFGSYGEPEFAING